MIPARWVGVVVCMRICAWVGTCGCSGMGYLVGWAVILGSEGVVLRTE
jgi:hypothetical protein